jgi:hypothetical protein
MGRATLLRFSPPFGTLTPKPSIIDQIKRPSPLGEKHAGGMCQTQCNWIGGRQFCNTYCF